MSVRIHQLSKEIGMDNKELIKLLQSRGFEVKSPSSTIDNISAESLVEEFASKNKEVVDSEDNEEKKEPIVSKETPKVAIPKGPIVRSANEINLARELNKTARANNQPSAKPPVPKPPQAVRYLC